MLCVDTSWGSHSVTYCFWGYFDLALSSDPSSRKIMSRVYILYCFKVGIPNLDCGYMYRCQSVLYWFGSL